MKITNMFLRFGVALPLLLSPAYAVDVIYDTTGSFSGGVCSTVGYSCSGGTLTGPGSLVLSYTGAVNDTYLTGPGDIEYAGFGQFQTTGGSPSSANADNLNGTTFTLNISQTSPEVLSTSVIGSITGSIYLNGSTVDITWTSGGTAPVQTTNPYDTNPALQFSLGQETYWVDNIPIQNATSQGGMTYVPGAVETTLPEPSFYWLTGLGIVGLLVGAGFKARRFSV